MSAKWDGKIALILSALSLFAMQALFAASPTRTLDHEIEGALSRYYEGVPVRVEVKAPGEVVLKGEVSTLADEYDIYEIASRVKGVKKVAVEIKVLPPEPMTDQQIKNQIVDGLRINSRILAPEDIAVNVNEGMVTLAGKVQTFKEMEAAEKVTVYQDGVKGMENNIQVLAKTSKPMSDQDIQALVNATIEDHFPLAKDKVKASVTAGRVSLSGTVGTLWEKDNIPREVKRVIGVTGVTSSLAL